jgi:hypothetical protein
VGGQYVIVRTVGESSGNLGAVYVGYPRWGVDGRRTTAVSEFEIHAVGRSATIESDR